MADYFTEEDEVLLDNEDGFVDPDLESTGAIKAISNADARRRLEKMLEEKRLKDELEDFEDY